MKNFEYVAPKTIREAVKALTANGKEARILAGGTDLIVQMRVGRRQPERVVDVKNIPELNEVSFSPRRGLVIGAAVPCHTIYENTEVVERYPGLIDTVSIVGGIQIQGRATVGGNLCNAAPSADTVPVLIAYGAQCDIVGPNGKRTLPVEEICTAPGQTCIAPDELLVSIKLPAERKNAGAHYLRFIPRNEMDIAVVGAAVNLTLDEDGTCTEAAVALGAVAEKALMVPEAAAALVGSKLDDNAMDNLAAAASDATAACRGTGLRSAGSAPP